LCLAVLLTQNLSLGSSSSTDSLTLLINSKDLGVKRDAFQKIVNSGEIYSDEILTRLIMFSESKIGSIDELNTLIYLCAVVKDKRFLDPLWKMLTNDEYLVDECIYDCPIIFSLSIYAIATDWDPPEKLDDQNIKVDDFYRDYRSLSSLSLQKDHAYNHISGPGIDEQLKEVAKLSEEDIIKQAGPQNRDSTTRYAAAYELEYSVADDQNLMDLYWLVINELIGASKQYRSAIYRAIFRAEKSRALSKVKP
jgi:hypothetical protein